MCTCANDNCSGCGSFAVPIGPPGPQGPTGAQGPAGAAGAAGPNWMSWTFEDGSDAFSTLTGGNGTFKTLAAIIYPGKNIVPVPKNIKTCSWDAGVTGNDYDIELYDATNNQTLAQIISENDTAVGSIQQLVINNPIIWPQFEALLYLRIRDNSGSADKIRVASMTWHD